MSEALDRLRVAFGTPAVSLSRNFKTTTPTINAFIDPSATMPDSSVVWHFGRVLAQVRIGERVSIGGGAEIGRGSVIGDDSRISAGVFLPPNSIVGKSVFIGPNATFTDDPHPRVLKPGDPPYNALPPVIHDFAAIGAGAVICPGVTIGEGARVAAGAIVTKDVVPHGMVRGMPARPRTMPRQWEHAQDCAAAD